MLQLAGVYLTTRLQAWCWPVGAAGVALAAVVFFEARLYGEVGLNLLYFGLQLYGWYYWTRGVGEQTPGVSELKHWGRCWGALLVGGYALGALLSLTPSDVPFWDGYTTAASLVAQVLMTRKIRHCWLWWIAVDAVYIGLFAYKGLFLFSLLSGIYLWLAWLGWRSWGDSDIDTVI